MKRNKWEKESQASKGEKSRNRKRNGRLRKEVERGKIKE